MKNSIWALAIAAVLLSTGISQAADVTAQTGFEFDWWKDSEKNIGYQGFIPLPYPGHESEFFLRPYGYTAF